MLPLFLLALIVPMAAQSMPDIQGPFKALNGETCVVCNHAVSDEDAAFLVDGQRVAVMAAMQEEFLRNPLEYVAKYRPEGMVFSARQAGDMTSTYFWLGSLLLAGLVFGAVCGHMAMLKGYSTWRWFFLGLFFSIPACLALANKPSSPNAPDAPAGLARIPDTRPPAACPQCGASNHPSASQCSSCGGRVEPTAPSEVSAC